MAKRIYIADDEENIRVLIMRFLQKDGYDVTAFANGDLLYEAFLQKEPHLIILDIMMPGTSGLAICAKIRDTSTVPILMLTAKDTDADYIAGISLGSDDYFTKPVSPVVLTMRVKAILRRVEMDTEKEPETIHYGDLTLKPEGMLVNCRQEPINLTLTEFNLLFYLMENKNKAVSREELLNKIWGYDSVVETRATDDTVKRLRRKLQEANSEVQIDTVWGFGFRISKNSV